MDGTRVRLEVPERLAARAVQLKPTVNATLLVAVQARAVLATDQPRRPYLLGRWRAVARDQHWRGGARAGKEYGEETQHYRPTALLRHVWIACGMYAPPQHQPSVSSAASPRWVLQP